MGQIKLAFESPQQCPHSLLQWLRRFVADSEFCYHSERNGAVGL